MAEADPVPAAITEGLADVRVTDPADFMEEACCNSSSNSFLTHEIPENEEKKTPMSSQVETKEENSVNPKEVPVLQQLALPISTHVTEVKILKEKLLQMVKTGQDKCVRRLLDKGVDINTCDQWGRSPLHWAVRNSQDLLVDLLVARGANLEARDHDLRTPLHEAVIGGNDRMVEKLVKRGCDRNVQDKDGNTPLHLAIINSQNKDECPVVDALTPVGSDEDNIDLEIKNHKGQTPMDIAETMDSIIFFQLWNIENLQNINSPKHLEEMEFWSAVFCRTESDSDTDSQIAEEIHRNAIDVWKGTA